MRIDFCSTHFKSTNLDLLAYMVLLAYESAQPTNKELQAMFKVTERTVIRKRNVLVKKKFMEKLGSKYYVNYAIAPKALP